MKFFNQSIHAISKLSFLFLLFAILITSACSDNAFKNVADSDSEEAKVEDAQIAMDNSDYDSAVETLSELYVEKPSMEVTVDLATAHMGKAGMDTLKLMKLATAASLTSKPNLYETTSSTDDAIQQFYQILFTDNDNPEKDVRANVRAALIYMAEAQLNYRNNITNGSIHILSAIIGAADLVATLAEIVGGFDGGIPVNLEQTNEARKNLIENENLIENITSSTGGNFNTVFDVLLEDLKLIKDGIVGASLTLISDNSEGAATRTKIIENITRLECQINSDDTVSTTSQDITDWLETLGGSTTRTQAEIDAIDLCISNRMNAIS